MATFRWKRRLAREGTSPLLPQQVAYSLTDDDGILVFHFRGIATPTLFAIFDFLCPSNGKGVAKTFDAYREHDPEYIHGHGYWRKAVELYCHNSFFCSIQSLCLLVESVFRRMAMSGSTITRFSIDDFLNLSSDTSRYDDNSETAK